jgi:hypothetical protein
MLHKKNYIAADINIQPTFLIHNRHISNVIMFQMELKNGFNLSVNIKLKKSEV